MTAEAVSKKWSHSLMAATNSNFYPAMMLMRAVFLVIIFQTFISVRIQAQVTGTDRVLPPAQQVVLLYKDSVKENLRLYNGNEFAGNYPGVPGHPFFEYPDPRQGSIFYDGVRYPDVQLSYDIINDEIIFTDPVKNRVIKLVAQKVDWFTIQDHLFVNIRPDSNSVNFPGSGFYEALYDGAALVLSKRKKQYDQSLKADEASKFIEWTSYYIRKDGVYHSINNKRSMMSVYKDQKPELEKYMDQQGLNFKKDPVTTMVKITDFYTQLKKNK